MSYQRRTQAINDLNVQFGSFLCIEPQSSHADMLPSILNPIWSSLEVKLTAVKLGADEAGCKIKKVLPPGYAIKKVDALPCGFDQSTCSELYFTRGLGQSISIYRTSDDIGTSAESNTIYISPVKPDDSNERRRNSLVKFKVILPEGWQASYYEFSAAQDKKQIGKDYSNKAHKLFVDLLAGNASKDEAERLALDFVNTYCRREICSVAELNLVKTTDFMPAHRSILMTLIMILKVLNPEVPGAKFK